MLDLLLVVILTKMVPQLLFVLLTLGLLLPAGAQPTAVQELYVKPTEDTSCPEPCHTLDEYVQNATQYFVSNTVFKFLPGTHSLSFLLNISGVSNLTMVGTNGSVVINCINSQNLSFTEISNLTLKDLSLSCVLNLTDLLNVNLLRVSMEPSPPSFYGLEVVNAVNILGTSTFTSFHMVGYFYTSRLSIQYTDHLSRLPSPSNQLTIRDSNFSRSATLSMKVELYQSKYSVNLLFENLTALPLIDLFDYSHGTGVSNNLVRISTCMSLAALRASTLLSTQVIIENSIFQQLHIYYDYFPFSIYTVQSSVVFQNVTFYNFMAFDSLIEVFNTSNMSFVDCKFLNNVVSESVYTVEHKIRVIHLVYSRGISFTDCEFSNNRGTPISAESSQYIMSGSNTFINNSAYAGGAMAFYGQSYVTFTDGLDIKFMNNAADSVGGAIYVDHQSGYNQCFFQFQSWTEVNLDDLPATVTSDGNDAENGGSTIYGTLLDTCTVNGYPGWVFASPLFHFDSRNASDFSAITSDPLRVCLCEDGRPSCSKVFTNNHTHYPGEAFNLSAVMVGDRFGTVDGSVYAQILPVSEGVAELGHLQRLQRVEHHKCTNVSYTFFSSDSAVTIALTASSVQIQEYPNPNYVGEVGGCKRTYQQSGNIISPCNSVPVFINVTLLPCPLGFVLSGDPPGCVCDTQLQENHISCDLTSQTVQRHGTEWVNASFDSNGNYSGVIVSQYCRNNYCKPETVDVNLEHPDTQCAFLHSGILCGGCQSGLSRTLGSAQCLPCSNAYLALLIPFALAGFVLVFFIKLLNLTVAQGTLNGLIFYANILQANQAAWKPNDDTYILTVFIAWLNLDLGIETCFFDGLDAYWATWLQFVFPLYIWAIAISIIVLSHYFRTAARIVGNNSVPTLATLFLFSYPKLLRTIIFIFQFSILDYPDGSTEVVWSYDSNTDYFSPSRIPLFLVAMASVLFLWLPYTGILLFAQCLQRSSNYRVGKVLAKLKPFLDAYFGPLKDKHRYWVGLLLLLRGILFISFAVVPVNSLEVNRLITLVAVLCAMVYLVHVGGVYKKKYLSLLENSFLLNLGILAGGTPYAGKAQSALVYTSVGIAFTQFVVIVAVHCISRLRKTQLVYRLRLVMKPEEPRAVDQADENVRLEYEPVVNRAGVPQLMISYSEYREPVLKYMTNQS